MSLVFTAHICPLCGVQCEQDWDWDGDWRFPCGHHYIEREEQPALEVKPTDDIAALLAASQSLIAKRREQRLYREAIEAERRKLEWYRLTPAQAQQRDWDERHRMETMNRVLKDVYKPALEAQIKDMNRQVFGSLS